MARVHSIHRCAGCGTSHSRWAGRCAGCGAWNTLVEQPPPPGPGRRVGGALSGPVPVPIPLCRVEPAERGIRPTGLGELDRVLAGGLVPGSVTLLGGEPGIGKSTLLLQAMASMAQEGARALLVSAEESPQQVRLRAQRLGALPEDLWLVAETALPGMLAVIEDLVPDVVVVDSIQTVFDPEIGSAAGGVTQVRQCANRLVRAAKAGAGDRAPSVVLVGQVTKDGSLAGPRVLEHVVDTVLSFEGERHHALRLLRATKHRFGATGELGLFEMTSSGLTGVSDPSALLLGDRRPGVAGGVVVPAMEGHRPLLVELQVLTVVSSLPMARRSAQGLDGGRLALLLAVLERWLGLVLVKVDVFASVAGGVRVCEPAADLALGLALVSAAAQVPLPADLVACGEVGLGGEVRQVSQIQRRLAEAARLGFTRAMVPLSSPPGPPGLELVRVATLAEAVGLLRLPVAEAQAHGGTGGPGPGPAAAPVTNR